MERFSFSSFPLCRNNGISVASSFGHLDFEKLLPYFWHLLSDGEMVVGAKWWL